MVMNFSDVSTKSSYSHPENPPNVPQQNEKAVNSSSLLHSPQQLKKLADNVLGVLYQFKFTPHTGEMIFPYISAGCEVLFELTPQQVQKGGTLLLDVTHPDEQSQLKASILESATTLQRWQWEGRCFLPSGNIKWIKASAQPEKLADGSILWDGWILDITEQKQQIETLEHLNETLESRVAERTEALRQSEQRLNNILDSLQDVIWSLCPQTHQLTYINSAAETLYGYSLAEFYKNSDLWLDVIHPDDQERVNLSQELLLKQGFKELEYRIIRVDGEVRWVRDRAQLIYDQAGAVIRIDGIITDISDRKQAEAEQQKLAALVENSSDFIGIADLDGSGLFVNSAGLKMVGLSNVEAVKQTSMFDYFPADRLPELQAEILPIVQQEKTWSGEFEFKNFATGHSIPVEFSLFLVNDVQTGEPLCYASVTRDISDRKAIYQERERTLATLQATEERLQLAIQANNDGVWDWDIKTNAVFFAPRWKEILGYADHEIQNDFEEWKTRIHPDDVEHCMATINDAVVNKQSNWTLEHRLQGKDGQYRWIISRGQTLWDEAGNAVRMVGSHRDVTERKEIETQLQASEKRYQTLAEASPIGVFFTDTQGNCLYTNHPWRQIAGLTVAESLGQGWSGAIHPDDRDRVFAEWYTAVAENQSFRTECRFQRPDGKVTWVISQALAVEDQGEVQGFVGTITDISDRKSTEIALQQKTQDLETTLQELKTTQSQLIQSEKMSSLGQLVAGVAHEINNPVSFIHGNLIHVQDYAEHLIEIIQTYQQYVPSSHPEVEEVLEDLDFEFLQADMPKLLSSMRMGSNRIREIVSSLRNFSRLDEAESKTVNIHDGIDNTLMILNHRIKATPEHPEIVITKNYGNVDAVECYPGQLNQVFMNVLVNALDALELRDRHRDYQEIVQHPSQIQITTVCLNHERVRITIQDNGPGIPESAQTRIFDPFFTTKAIGKGTGLGMSISYQVITEKHNGTLTFQSEPNQGTAFIIEIPLKRTT
jgi:PAS domain S-box-containing protein